MEKRTAELKTREFELSEQKEMLTTTIDSLGHPFYVVDAKSYEILLMNKSARELLKGRAITKCHKLTHNLDIPCNSKDHPCPLEIIRKTKQPVVLEHVHYDEYGIRYYAEVHGFPIFDENGELIQMIEYSLNINDRKLAEAELLKAKNKTEAILKASTNGIITINQNGKFESFNTAAEKIFGYTQEEVLDKKVNILMPEEHAEKHDSYIQNYLKTGIKKVIDKQVEVVARRKNGELFPLEIGISEVHLETTKLFTAVFSDITERKRMEEELSNINFLSDKALALSRSVFWIYDFNDKDRLYLSDRGHLIFGLEKSEDNSYNRKEWFKGIEQADHQEAKENRRLLIRSIKNPDIIFDDQYPYKRPDNGEIIWIHSIGDVVVDEDGKPTRILGVVQDITELKAAEEDLTQKLEELERFNRLVVGREITMIELKKEVNDLLVKQDKAAKYKIVEDNEQK